MIKNQFFNTQHAPIGAHASLTLGFPGARGGMDLERCEAPNQDILIALESADKQGEFDVMPFIDLKAGSEAERYVASHDGLGGDKIVLRAYEQTEIERKFAIASDAWHAGDLTYTLYSPGGAIPDPALGDTVDLKRALVPAVWAEVTVDNSKGARSRILAVGFNRIDPCYGLRHIAGDNGLVGIGSGMDMALVSDHPGAWSSLGLAWQEMLDVNNAANRSSGLGGQGMIGFDVPANTKVTLRFAYCFHRAGVATAGVATRYLYNRWFDSTEAVGRFALDNFDDARLRATRADEKLRNSKLSEAQKFTVAHATRSYLFSTQMLELDGQPLWNVNEGEYNMINTLDLVPDHSLYEVQQHPWTVRNVLDQYTARYSYTDDISWRGEKAAGGISFTHDMGAAAVFTPAGRSSYERTNLSGCFSHMTMEELLNWVLTAGLYVQASNDLVWLKKNTGVLLQCLESMERRDHPDPAQRIGVMRWDSSRCGTGREITTYDCIDLSLGQASGNTYLGGKLWAASVVLARLFERVEEIGGRGRAQSQAQRAAATITAAADANGRIPALLEGKTEAIILPVIEGLAYAHFGGAHQALALDGEFADYFKALSRHMMEHVLRDDTCLYPDGGWRISSTSANTFPAKVYVCQFAARHLLRLPIADINHRADVAHANWQLHPELSAWCWSEQVVDGVLYAAKYYPRGVNSSVWLTE
ncbi:MAG: glycoside hydrolase family 52 protein [Pseudomonadota bacterium]